MHSVVERMVRPTAACMVVAASLLALPACSPPPPGVHETLTISDQGEFMLNGRRVPKDRLRSAILAERERFPTLFAEIVASPRADIEAVKFAVEVLKASQVRFAFIDEKIMKPGKPQSKEESPAM